MRLFFALWPPEEVRAGLRAALPSLVPGVLAGAGRMVPVEKLHVTLAFLGERPASALPAIRAAGARAAAPRFVLHLDVLGHWRRSCVLWCGPSEVPGELHTLHDSLRGTLADEGVVLDRRPFRPHLTLARHAPRSARHASWAALEWPVDAFSLVESRTSSEGASYRIEAAWPLG